MQPMQISSSLGSSSREKSRWRRLLRGFCASTQNGNSRSDTTTTTGSCGNPLVMLVTFALPTLICLVLLWHWIRRDPYTSSPFCDPDGTCHEVPYKPSPRTVYSSWNKQQYQSWWRFHHHLEQTAKDFQGQRPLVLLGDSITEAWLGTGMGEPRHRAQGVPEVLDDWMETCNLPWNPLVLAISGDQTQHLLWRLANGELVDSVAHNKDALFVVLIGTNNLGAGDLPEPTAQGVLAVVDYLVQRVKGRILLLELLPRGDGPTWLPDLCPPRCDKQGHSFTSFLPAIAKVNDDVRQGVQQRRSGGDKEMSEKLDILDCGDVFVQNVPSGEQVNTALMPDRLHPNAAGHKLLANCISKWIRDNIVL